LDFVCLLILAVAGNFWGVAIGYMLLQFASNVAHGPCQGLLPDLIPEGKRGFAAGAKNVFDMLGIIAAGLVTGVLMGGAEPKIVLTIAVIAGVLLVATIVTLLGARERATGFERESTIAPRLVIDQLRELFRIDFSAHQGYARLLATRFCVFLATYLVQSFGLYYVRDALGMPDPSRIVGGLMAAVGVSLALAAYPAGVLSERWGRRGITLFACALTGLGIALLLVVNSVSGLWILGCVIGVGMGAFASVNWAWATDLVPASEAGKYLGLSNLATGGSAAVARLFGPGIDLVNVWAPNAGYSVLFLLATAVVFVGMYLALGVPEGRTRQPSTAKLRNID
jgi:MFS family permease